MIFLGLLSYAFGFTAFVLPEKVVTGGVTGLSSLLFFGLGWNVAITYYGINILLLAIAYRSVGRQFVIRTIIGATLATLMLGVLQPLFTAPIVAQQPFMNIIIGAIFCGVGIGTVFVHNGSTEIDATYIEGSHWETSNDYGVFVYLNDETSLYDRLIGVEFFNTVSGR